MTDLADAVVRAAGLLGVVLLAWLLVARAIVPATVRSAHASAFAARERALRPVVAVGALATWVAAALEPALTVRALVGSVPPDLYLDFLRDTRAGTGALLRAACAVAAGAFLLRSAGSERPTSWTDLLAATVLGAGLFVGFAISGHAAAIPGPIAVPAATVHQAVATVWIAAVASLVVLPLWTTDRRDALRAATGRVARVALASVAVLTATGAYATTLHVGSWEGLTATPYGVAWWTKMAVVAIVLAIAAVQRLHHVPAVASASGPKAGFRRLLAVESVLLATAFGVTALLATRPPPH